MAFKKKYEKAFFDLTHDLIPSYIQRIIFNILPHTNAAKCFPQFHSIYCVKSLFKIYKTTIQSFLLTLSSIYNSWKTKYSFCCSSIGLKHKLSICDDAIINKRRRWFKIDVNNLQEPLIRLMWVRHIPFLKYRNNYTLWPRLWETSET